MFEQKANYKVLVSDFVNIIQIIFGPSFSYVFLNLIANPHSDFVNDFYKAFPNSDFSGLQNITFYFFLVLLSLGGSYAVVNGLTNLANNHKQRNQVEEDSDDYFKNLSTGALVGVYLMSLIKINETLLMQTAMESDLSVIKLLNLIIFGLLSSAFFVHQYCD